MTATESLAVLFDRPDQARVRDDLAAFFGPRAETFLGVYDRMRSRAGRRRLVPMAWSWAAFWLGFTWFFYRKMYLYGAGILLLPVVLGLLLSGSGALAITIVTATYAKAWHVQIGLRRVLEADRLMLEGEARHDYLRRAGGVSVTAGLLAGSVYAASIAAAIWLAVRPLLS